MLKRNEKYVVVILSILIMVFSIHIGTTLLKKVQMDATDENIFTLSEGSKTIVSKISSPLRLKLYYSKTAANKGSDGIRLFNNYYQYIKDLLEQYVAISKNSLTLEVIDPRPDTRDEEDAVAYGLKKFNLTETETYFFGLVVESPTGGEKIIEFFNPENKNRVEYDITKIIYSSTNPKKQRVGILSSMDIIKEDVSPYMAQLMRFQGRSVEGSWHIVNLLKEFYDVVKIEMDSEEISGVDVLMVIHPRNLSERTLFNIDQFVMKGGKLLVLVDPMSLTAQNMDSENKIVDLRSDLSLLKKWGIEYSSNKFVGDKLIAGAARFNPNLPAMKALPLIVCRDVCYQDHQDIISSSLGGTNFIFVGALKALETEGVTVTPIVTTTEKGNTFSGNERQLQNPQALWDNFQEGKEALPIALKAIGKFKSNYPDGITVELKEEDDKKKGKTKKLEATKESKEDTAIIVFSDVDFIADNYAFRPTLVGKTPSNDNSVLLLNSVETLAGSTDLLSVRSKPRIDRSFDVIRNIELEAEKKTESKVKEINDRIRHVQNELRNLGRQANDQNIALIQNEGIKKKKELSRQVAILKRELRDVKREGRERVEALGQLLQALNTLLVPFLILVLGVFINYRRKKMVV